MGAMEVAARPSVPSQQAAARELASSRKPEVEVSTEARPLKGTDGSAALQLIEAIAQVGDVVNVYA